MADYNPSLRGWLGAYFQGCACLEIVYALDRRHMDDSPLPTASRASPVADDYPTVRSWLRASFQGLGEHFRVGKSKQAHCENKAVDMFHDFYNNSRGNLDNETGEGNFVLRK